VDTAASPRVLVIGLDPYRVPGPWDPEPVAKAIEAGLAEFAEHGVGVRTCLIGLDGSDDVAAVVGRALRAHPWECVTVGGGLRHSDDQVLLLEQVVNLIRRHAPDAAIAFNSTPATTYEAAARWIDRFGRTPALEPVGSGTASRAPASKPLGSGSYIGAMEGAGAEVSRPGWSRRPAGSRRRNARRAGPGTP
jgi:hypothetical protein